ncbi:hypothetical protein [Streptomyces sp. NPDC050600]|uniref:hypothetical protein n=1 Tax=Streptomyces sp. NPDC050600 TaxID=3157213 RepID=UPI00342F75AA
MPPYGARFHRAVNAATTLLINPAATWTDIQQRYRESADQTVAAENNDPRTYTRAEAARAVNAGIDLAAEHSGRNQPDDLDNFLGNAVITLLDEPNATFDDIVFACYDDEPDEVRSWL